MSTQRVPSNIPILRRDEPWRKWSEITVKVGPGLPMSFNTLDMYHLFMDFGDLESIELFENGAGVRDGSGRVKFTRVKGPFWEKPFEYEWDNARRILRLVLDKPRRSFKITSPINKQILYPEKFKFKPRYLEFGFMNQPNVMMSMFTADLPDITFHVDLLRRRIDVTFRVYLTKADCSQSSVSTPSMSSGEDEEEEEERNLDRFENYRFLIPFADLGTLYEEVTTDDKSHRVFIIPLPKPPFFWRQLHNLSRSHDFHKNFWSAWDMWFRQTTIAYNPRLKAAEPITLKQSRPFIDTGRWTTYRFTFDFRPSEIPEFDQMISALRDFNVETKIFGDFKVSKEQLPPVWSWIDVDQKSFLSGFARKSPPALSHPVRYQLEVCISHDCLSEYNLTPEFIRRLAELPVSQALALLEHIAEKKKRIFDPMTIFNLSGIKGSTVGAKLPNYCQVIRKATITPSMVYFATPTVEFTNRVVRHYAEHVDRFLRVQFMDEKSQASFFCYRINSTDKMTMHEVFSRIKHALDNGVKIGELHYEFLAFGNSQIREHGAYFFAPTDHITAADIRRWMGDFKEIRTVAKHSARLGQCFSSTRTISSVKVELHDIEDIERNGSNFTDGVGKISEFLAQLIVTELKLPQDKPPPSCFQFRLGGCKGVLTISPDLGKREVHIRPSQRKFLANHSALEVIRWSHYATATLNRQLIIVLSSLGINDNIFIHKLLNMMKAFKYAMDDSTVALPLLCKAIDHNQFTLTIAGMIRNGFMASSEPFFTSLLRLWRAWSIKYLKEKARIVIEEGAFLLGVVDETGKLNGYVKDAEEADEETPFSQPIAEIFLQISDPDPGHTGEFKIIEGICIVARNPSLHPGDIRTVRAVNVPELHHLRDVVVFPQTGDRAIPSMLSGGDLDGDDFIVIWDRDLTYKRLNYPPMDYTPPAPQVLSRDVEVKDITTFFVNYMKSDKLGTIASAHLAWADASEDGVMSDQCIQLAAEHSKAVDYVKTGEPAEMNRNLRRNKYPHFMGKEPDKTYISKRILGKLYDLVEKVDFVPSYEIKFDTRILNAYTLDKDMLETAKDIKAEYDSAMNRIMAQHEIASEFEVFSTFVLDHSQAAKDFKFHEEIGTISSTLKERFQKVVREKFAVHDEEEIGPVVAAMYTVTHQELVDARKILHSKKLAAKRNSKKDPWALTAEDEKNMPLISFPWLFEDILGKVARRKHPFEDLPGNDWATITTDTDTEVQNGDTEFENGVEEFENGVEEFESGVEEFENDNEELENGDERVENGDEGLEYGDEGLENGDEELEYGYTELENGSTVLGYRTDERSSFFSD
ncbi:hypothetical protein RUND412_001605 [Rhizina undulata]